MATPTVEIIVTESNPQGGGGSGGSGGSTGGGGRSSSGSSAATGGQGDPGNMLSSMLGMGKNTQMGRMASAAGIDIGGMMSGIGGSTLAAAAGPMMIAAAAVKAIGAAGDAVGGAIRGVASTLTDFISGNFYAPLRSAADSVSEVILWISPALGFVTKVFLGVADAGKMLTDAFLNEAKRLQDYSPQVATALAMGEYRTVVRDIKEADVLGEGLGRLVAAQTRSDEAMAELFLELKEWLLPYVVEFAEFAADCLEWIRDHKDVFHTNSATTADTLAAILNLLPIKRGIELLWENREDLKALVRKGLKEKEEEDTGPGMLYQDFMGTVGDIFRGTPRPGFAGEGGALPR